MLMNFKFSHSPNVPCYCVVKYRSKSKKKAKPFLVLWFDPSKKKWYMGKKKAEFKSKVVSWVRIRE